MGYGSWLHGEAVAAGMAMAADLSRRMDWLTSNEAERIEASISSARLPIPVPRPSIELEQFEEPNGGG